MGFLAAGRRAGAGAVLAAIVLVTPAVGTATAAGTGAPAAADEDSLAVTVSDAAKKLAVIRDERDAAEERIAAAQARADEAGAQVQTAQDDVDAALAVATVARKRAGEAADSARQATAAETRLKSRAKEADAALQRMVRNAYINALANSDLELYVSFATDGPSALSAFAQRDMAYDNLTDASLVEAQRLVREADDAAATADEARSVYDAAAAEHENARATLLTARRGLNRAAASLSSATADIRAGEADVRKTDDAYQAAQTVYKKALQESLAGGGAPISSGPAAEEVWRAFKKAGFSEESIAGILGNLQQESGVDPTAVQAGGPGRGLAQWSQGGRWDNGPQSLIAFASGQGLDPWDADTQVRFMIYEMENVLTSFDVEMFKDMTDVLAATVYFHDIFEGSADSADFVRSVRGSYALQWYARLA